MQELTIGIDIGGTNTKLGIVDRQGTMHYQSSLPMAHLETFDDFFKAMVVNLREGMSALPPDEYTVMGVGVGAANGNYYTGCIEHATNLKWRESLPLSKMFEEEFRLPCLLTNDANAAALGEMIYGNAKGMKDFIVITLGTGLGSGIVCGGEMLYGHNGIAGELGHMNVHPSGRYCGCGKRGCLETYVSASGIKRTVYKLLADYTAESELRAVSFENLDTKMITEAALRGDAVAKAAYEYTGRILGMKLADSVVHTDPEAIILFGGLSLAGDLIFEPTIRHMEENMMPVFKGRVKVIPSVLQNQAAPILGSASLIWDYLDKRGRVGLVH
ncbi:MAG: glucokinase [Candidatus Nephrothrix sp. EaCA]|nr:MAG: glucokinase [Candidatus Nephrothrix sp. EaCA]